VFYDNTGGIVRFLDWALVTTTLGTMAEPFQVDSRHSMRTPFTDFDPTDEMARIDEMIQIDSDKSMILLSGGINQTIGGTMRPKTGR
jgi:hypothetical protein